MLALTNSLESELRDEVNGRLEKLTLNPFENDLDAEANVAREQYEALVTYAGKPDGLAARLERDRRAELVSLEHGPTAQLAFRLANVFSFGKYVHREQLTSDMPARLDIARRLDYHTKFLQQVSRSNFEIDVACDLALSQPPVEEPPSHAAEAMPILQAAAVLVFAAAPATSAPRLGTTTETTAYFIVAEALTNVVKHARATRTEVRDRSRPPR